MKSHLSLNHLLFKNNPKKTNNPATLFYSAALNVMANTWLSTKQELSLCSTCPALLSILG